MAKADVKSTRPKEQLFILIKSLTKAEKRNFKLYVNRIQSKGDIKFVQLFDAIDKMEAFDNEQLLKKMRGISKSQLANLKRHLYKQILISLRLIHIQKNIDIEIREQIDFARILYGKGLYLQSLRLLDRTKQVAIDNHQDILHLEILEFQKLIEERHITRSRTIENKVEDLVEQALKRSAIIHNSCKLSNLKIEIHGFYIQFGHVKNAKDTRIVKELFKSRLASINQENLTFFESVYLHQSYVWYYYTLLDFEQCYEAALKWVRIFHEVPNLIEEEPDLYIRGVHYMLTSLYNLGYLPLFTQKLKEFEYFEQQHGKQLKPNSKMLTFLYLYLAKLNCHFIDGSFEAGLPLVSTINRQLKKFEPLLDVHRFMVFYYKIAYLYFGAEDYGKAIEYLNKVIDLRTGHLREDIQCYARLMQLLAHFELGHFHLLEYLVQSTYRFLGKVEELNPMQLETLRFVKGIINRPNYEHKDALLQFKQNLEQIIKDPYEQRGFIYLDVLSWARSKVENTSLANIILQKQRKASD
ncbi:MAG: hypothetical protein AAF985_22050 [Bacteroidota bacterium]